MELFISIATVHLVLAFVALVFILRSKLYSGSQKMIQCLFVFLVPLAGPAATLLVYWGDRQKVKLSSTKYGESIDEHYRKHVGGLFRL